jgi:hypothetical protein
MNSPISLIVQAGALRSYFPESKISRMREDRITWEHNISPSLLSDTYKLKLQYSRNEGARVHVLNPKPLALAEGKLKLPHVYSTEEQSLCLYYPKWREWHPGRLYVHTLIPWASEWLYHYEFWVGSGVWRGGGIEHENTAENEQAFSNPVN